MFVFALYKQHKTILRNVKKNRFARLAKD